MFGQEYPVVPLDIGLQRYSLMLNHKQNIDHQTMHPLCFRDYVVTDIYVRHKKIIAFPYKEAFSCK